MSESEFVKWLKGYIKGRSFLMSDELDNVRLKLNTIDNWNIPIDVNNLPVAGSTVNYPQYVWVNSSTVPDIDFKISYTNGTTKNSKKDTK